jgi:hypothetical protein
MVFLTISSYAKHKITILIYLDFGPKFVEVGKDFFIH